MPELAQRLGLDLADALARDRELVADLFQRVVLVHADAEAHADYTLLPRRERGERARRGLAQVRLDSRIDRQDRVLVFNEIAEMGILLVADRSFQRQRLLGDLEHLAHLLERHAELLSKLLGPGLAADLVEHLARLTHDLADALDHVHGDADGARLVSGRARDRLPDPPGGIGRELVATAILEFIDRLHQADIAFLDQVEELQAAVGVFLGDGDNEAQVRLHHLLLGLARLALALLHHLHDLAELADLEPGLAREHLDLVAVLLDLLLVPRDEALPTLGGELRQPVAPARIELGALIVLEKILARDAVTLGEPHQAALIADQAFVDVVELFDQRVDARLIEPQRLHLADDVVLELLVFALLRGRERIVAQLVLDVLVLQPAQPLVGVGNVVEGLDHLGLELGLDGGKRERVLHIVVVEIAFAGRGLAALAVGSLGRSLERGRVGGRRRRLRQHGGAGNRRRAGRRHDRLAVGTDHRRRHGLGVGPGIGRFEVDDVAKEYLSLVELVAPNDDGLEGERALTQTGDHRFATSLDALGDRDLALAREKLHRAHFAQVHAHRIIRAFGRLFGLGLGRDLLLDLDQLAALALGLFVGLLARLFSLFARLLSFFARLLGLDHIDAHLAEHGEHVLDLLGIDLLGGQHRVDLVMGDVAALLGGADELPDGPVRYAQQRALRQGLGTLYLQHLFLLRRLLGLACHEPPQPALARAALRSSRVADSLKGWRRVRKTSFDFRRTPETSKFSRAPRFERAQSPGSFGPEPIVEAQ